MCWRLGRGSAKDDNPETTPERVAETVKNQDGFD